MPRRTIFVRDDDLNAFEAIENRPEWLHRAIHAAKAMGLVQRDGPVITIAAPVPEGDNPGYIGDDEPETYIDPDQMP